MRRHADGLAARTCVHAEGTAQSVRDGPPEQDHWHWRVVAGLEGLEGPGARGDSVKLEGRLQPRSVLLRPQEVEAV